MIDVHHLAELAQLRLTRQEAEELRVDLERIAAYVSELGDVSDPLDAVPPTAAQLLREDAPSPSLSKEDAQGGAPKADEGGFVVPSFWES